jgi:hypothetical protein
MNSLKTITNLNQPSFELDIQISSMQLTGRKLKCFNLRTPDTDSSGNITNLSFEFFALWASVKALADLLL